MCLQWLFPGTFDIGRPSRAFPVTPPCVRVRTRRFGELCGHTRMGVPAGLSVSMPVPDASALHSTCLRASPSSTALKARSPWIFRRSASGMTASYLPLPPFGPSGNPSPTMPSADSCTAIKAPHGTLSPDSGTRRRPPGVSSAAFSAQPPGCRPEPAHDLPQRVRLAKLAEEHRHELIPRRETLRGLLSPTPPHDLSKLHPRNQLQDLTQQAPVPYHRPASFSLRSSKPLTLQAYNRGGTSFPLPFWTGVFWYPQKGSVDQRCLGAAFILEDGPSNGASYWGLSFGP